MNLPYDMVPAGPVYQSRTAVNYRATTSSAPISLRSLLAAALLALACAGPLWAQVEFPAPNWTASAAHAAAAQADANALLGPLYERARLGREQDLLAGLNGLAANEGLSVPARERILYEFAQGLGDLPPGSAGPEVLDFLMTYPARTLVPHPDNPRVGTPLFNIRGAAAGALAAWQRQAGYDAAAALMAQAGPDLAAAYLDDFGRATAPRRQGLAAALETATQRQLTDIAARAETELSQRPELTAVAARAALLLDDGPLLQRTLAAGRGPDLAGVLADAAGQLDEPARLELLAGLLDTAPPVNASLALAALAPGLLHRPEVTERLFGLLGDRELGASAALALSDSSRPEIRERLLERTQGDDLAARRAALALAAAGGAR